MLTTSSRISSAYALPDLKLFAHFLLDLARLKAAKEFISEANWEFSSASKVPNNSISTIRLFDNPIHIIMKNILFFCSDKVANLLVFWTCWARFGAWNKPEGPRFKSPHYRSIGFWGVSWTRSRIVWSKAKPSLLYIKRESERERENAPQSNTSKIQNEKSNLNYPSHFS